MGDIIRKYKPGILGVQEALKFQKDQLRFDLLDMKYETIGVGRDGGDNGEFSAIFYDSERFSVQSSGTFWLCDHPDVVGCKTFGNRFPRICTWALFHVKACDDREFYVYNTHLDHESANSRHRSALQILSKHFKTQCGIVFYKTRLQ